MVYFAFICVNSMSDTAYLKRFVTAVLNNRSS